MIATPDEPPILRQLVFDLDGTLVDSVRLTCAIIDAMLADRGIVFSADIAIARAMDAIGGERMIAAVMGPWCRDPALEIATFRARHAIAMTPADLAFPGVTGALARLADAGVALAICSNKPQPLCEKILVDLDLARHFRAIIGARPGLARKPAAEPAQLAMRAISADPATALYVGDSAVDVATADAAGLPVALVGWGYGVAAARLQAPAAPVFADAAHMLAYILRRKATSFSALAM